MNFNRPFFDPPADGRAAYLPKPGGETPAGDVVYLYPEEATLAVNVALATRRPLLVAGPPGSGKSTLAYHVAAVKRWRYLPTVVTSRTQADDFMAGFDALRRLNDAQAGKETLPPDAAYVEPGVLWWAFDQGSALWRGASPDRMSDDGRREFPRGVDPSHGSGPHAVVLIDEIDKADPDVPNDLLEPLDRRSFRVRHLKERTDPVTAPADTKTLVVITTNRERELPPAFMRRCVLLTLEAVNRERLIAIAKAHRSVEAEADPDGDDALYGRTADLLLHYQSQLKDLAMREPSTAEYLDTIRTCRELGVRPDTPLWEDVAKITLWKQDTKTPPSPPPASKEPKAE